ncbi:uncharacterized protein [Miscanthus floridulus]|uniref:uncharacterized protein n=1 Tax=Miscanthus floridulus TaxID=154761 RepID=UPI003458138A
MKRLTKVLMDGGSSLNIMYAKTLDAMGIDRTRIQLIGAPFHGIVPGKIETLTFEVVGFHGTYHAILGHPCYVKFMSIPNCTYLKSKMLGPCGVITISISFQCAYECEVKCCEHVVAIVASKELSAIREEAVKEAPDPKRSSKSFDPIEGTKEVHIDPSSSEGKVVRIGTTLSSK